MDVVINIIRINKEIHLLDLFLYVLKNPSVTFEEFQKITVERATALYSATAQLYKNLLEKKDAGENNQSLFETQQKILEEKESLLSIAKENFEKLESQEQNSRFENIKNVLDSLIEYKLKQSYGIATNDSTLNSMYDEIISNILGLQSEQNKIKYIKDAIGIIDGLYEFIASAKAANFRKAKTFNNFNISNMIEGTTTTTTTTTTATSSPIPDNNNNLTTPGTTGQILTKLGAKREKNYGTTVVGGVTISEDTFAPITLTNEMRGWTTGSKSKTNTSNPQEIRFVENSPDYQTVSLENQMEIDEAVKQLEDKQLQEAIAMSLQESSKNGLSK